ncbi:MAG: TonB family protein [Terracidiphilus sp.]|jgi:protein TonB
MFEDSTFESVGKIHTRSRWWMIATFGLNSSILLALILIPLIYPEALPKLAETILMVAPATPVEEPKPAAQPEQAPASQREFQTGVLTAPSQIPKHPYIPNAPEAPTRDTVVALSGGGPGSGPGNPFSHAGTHPDVRQAVEGAKHISSGVMAGMLIHKVVPKYPAIPLAIRLSGTVVLEATISRNGTIENLRVLSGPPMLQQAARDAVSQWRYRPYLLNGQPVEVETTVSVEFTLN